METVPLAFAKTHFSELVSEIVGTHERVTVTRNGSPAVIMLAVRDFESVMETLDLLRDPEAVRQLREAEEEVARGDYVTGEQMAEIMAQRTGRASA